MIENTLVRTRDKKRVNPVKYTFLCELRKGYIISNNRNPESKPMHSTAKRCSLEFLRCVVGFGTDVMYSLRPLRDLCFFSSPPHPLQRIDEQNHNEDEGNL